MTPENKPPSVSFEELLEMYKEGLDKNNKDWEDKKGDYEGAGPRPLDDDHFGPSEDY